MEILHNVVLHFLVVDAVDDVLFQLFFSAKLLQFVDHKILAGSWCGNPCLLLGERYVPEVCDRVLWQSSATCAVLLKESKSGKKVLK